MTPVYKPLFIDSSWHSLKKSLYLDEQFVGKSLYWMKPAGKNHSNKMVKSV